MTCVTCSSLSLFSASDVTTCNDNEYNCHTGKCVPETMRCDGKDDCENGLDEYFCSELRKERVILHLI